MLILAVEPVVKSDGNRIAEVQSIADGENGRARIGLASPRESGGSDGNPAKSTQGCRGEDEVCTGRLRDILNNTKQHQTEPTTSDP